MTRPVAGARVHVVGAGLAGLSAAVTLAGRGVPVVLGATFGALSDLVRTVAARSRTARRTPAPRFALARNAAEDA